MEGTHVPMIYRGDKYMVPLDFILKQHPGGKSVILKHKDEDITKVFEKYDHSFEALEILREYKVRPVHQAAPAAVPAGAGCVEGKVIAPAPVTMDYQTYLHTDTGAAHQSEDEDEAVMGSASVMPHGGKQKKTEKKKKKGEQKDEAASLWNRTAIALGFASVVVALEMRNKNGSS